MRIRHLVPVVLLAGCGGQLDGTEFVDQELAHASHAAVCTAAAGQMRCHARVIVDPNGAPAFNSTPKGYVPADLQSAYNLGASSTSTATIAIVDAFDNPNAESDLAVYRSQFGLPPCTTANGCFKKVNQTGGSTPPSSNASWGQEIDLDIEIASAACPSCKILLVEANSATMPDLGAAENTAAALGAAAVSNSWGGGEYSAETQDEGFFNHPGVAITVSSGDAGFGVEFPASSRYVTAVGGTHLVRSATARGWSETAWSGAGSGCSAFIPKPTWQKDTGCAVSSVADPNTGVAVYDSFGHKSSTGWLTFGGTSAAAPFIAGVFARANNTAGPSYPYGHTASLHDVTSGSNGSCGGTYLCTAGVGYDGPTGLGTPNGTGAF